MKLNEISFKDAVNKLLNGRNITLSKKEDTSYSIFSSEYHEEEKYIGLYGEKPNVHAKYAFMLTDKSIYKIAENSTLYVICDGEVEYVISIN